MEARLQPVNAILGLLTPGDVNPAALADAGFRLAGLEVPIVGPDGRVVVDVVLFHPGQRHLVLLEAKSGGNVDLGQAERYAALDAVAVVQATGVSVPQRGAVSVEVAYVCMEGHADRIRQGLERAGLDCALILVAEHTIALDRPEGSSTPLDDPWTHGPVRLTVPVARLLPFDHESDPSAFEPAVRGQLVAELTHRRPEVTIRLLAEQVVRYYASFTTQAQKKIVSKVRDVVRTIVEEDPETYRYVPRTGTRQEDAVAFLQTPEDRDTRGRTQSYQAMYSRRVPRHDDAEGRQMDLLDLLAEDTADEVGDGRDNGEEDGESDDD